MAKFSVRHWCDHAEMVEASSEVVLPLLEEYFSSKRAYECGCQLSFIYGGGKNKKPSVSPLYYASDKGLPRSVRMLLDKGADINARGGPCNTALQVASNLGRQDIVEILLAKGANVNASAGGEHGTALQAASYHGYQDIVRMLLGKGADVNGSGILGNALYAASYDG